MNVSFVHLSAFVKSCTRLGIDDDGLRELEQLLAEHPDAGAVLSGTGGLRKVRFSPSRWRRGKSGATRVCYLFVRTPSLIYLVDVFAKNEQSNLMPAEKSVVRKLVAQIEAFHRS